MRKIQQDDSYGKWKVIKVIVGPKVLCRCKCGTEQLVLRSNLLSTKTGGCRKCADLGRRNSGNGSWRGYGKIPIRYWNSLKRQGGNNKRRIPYEFSITIQDAWEVFEAQQGLCAFTKLPLTFTCGKIRGTASVDRIDNTKGYVLGNIQWVHKTINSMKGKLSESEFIEFCDLVSKYCGSYPC